MIAIIDYDAGNTRSVINALKRIDADFILTDKQDLIEQSDKVIFPGVGHAFAAMDKLKIKGLIPVLKSCQQPFLGICLGMQLLFERSEEGDTQCLGILKGTVNEFKPSKEMKVPHMGWNTNKIYNKNNAHLFKGLDLCETYFVHSFYADIGPDTSTLCDYHIPFSASVEHKNFYGVQFHPEKSGILGEQILKNFINL